MKTRFIFLLFTVGLLSFIFQSNSGGRAAAANDGNTGAPGESGLTCGTCHVGGAFTTVEALGVFEVGTMTPVTTYVPGTTYDVSFGITATTGTPSGYGFQMTALDAANADAGTFQNLGANVQMAAAANVGGRTYVEHGGGTSASGVFMMQWVAPTAGTGDVTFYYAGNAVDGTGTTGNDVGSAGGSITITEAAGPMAAAFPYVTDFEANDAGWTTSGTNSSWQWGTPTGTDIPVVGPGTNAWVTNLTGNYNSAETSYLETPFWDLSAEVDDPIARFSFNTATEGCCDEVWMEMSIDGGATWTKVGASGQGDNWYNDAVNQWWEGTTGGWVTAEQIVVGAAGQADVRLRFAFSSDGSVTDEGVGVDNFFLVRQVADDLAVTSVDAPASGCGLTNMETVTITIFNNGTAAQTGFPVNYTVNGGTPVTETFTGTIMPMMSASYSFTMGADLSVAGSYTIDGYTSLATDGNASNDMSTLMVTSVTSVSGLPYVEDFEANDGGWIASGANSSWAWGTPTGTDIPVVGPGTSSWVTNLGGNYNSSELSYLTSPCFDLSAETMDPITRFSFNTATEGCCDETWMELSIDGGATYTKILDAGAAMNWYNDATNEWWEGSTGGWVTVENVVTGAAGEANVRLRFVFSSDGSVTDEGVGLDNFFLQAPPMDDVSITAISSPVSGCGLTATESVTITIMNGGMTTQTSIPVSYTVNGGTPVMETYTGSIAAGMSDTYTFTGTADLSLPGTYMIDAVTALASDSDAGNDMFSTTITSVATISAFPYSMDFEGGAGGWSASGANSSWAVGAPAGPVITAASSGTNAWVTNLTGDYNASELSYLTSPCLDFSALTADPEMTFALNYDTETCCDEGWMEISLDGGATWNKILDAGSAMNWYNDTGNEWWDGTSGGWVPASNTLVGTAGLANVVVRYVFSSDGSVQNDGFGVDLFTLSVPTCPAPTTLAASNITTNSADITWTSTGTAFNVEYGPTGYTPGGGTEVMSTSAMTSLTGLMDATTYDVYVQNACCVTSDLVITGAFDGPLSGGTPKGIELYAANPIADLSTFGLGSANNGGGTDGEEYTFPADVIAAGTYIYVGSDSTQFFNFFGFYPQYTTTSMLINGDDAVELFENGAVIDVFGDINMDGTGTGWDFLDGWAYRNPAQGNNNGTFDEANWTFSGTNQLEGGTTNATCTSPFPLGAFVSCVSSWSGPLNFTTLCLPVDGDTQADSIVIATLPYTDIRSTSPCYTDQFPTRLGLDVFYTLTTGSCTDSLFISTCADTTDFDTFIFLLDAAGNTIASNDDAPFGTCGSTLNGLNRFSIINADVDANTTYFVVVDGWGALDFGTYELNISETLKDISATADMVTMPSCNGGSDGSIAITMAGGTAPYTYMWSNGSTDEDPTGLPAGAYTGSVTDADGCMYVSPAITVMEPTMVAFAVDAATDVTCNGLADGSISITSSGGTAPYTYLWSNGATDEDITGLAAGSYTGTITDANNCTLVAGPVTIMEPAVLQADLTTLMITPVSCNDGMDGAISVDVIGGTAPYTYLWSNGATDEDITGLAAGSYTGTVTDANGCVYVTPAGVPVSEPSSIAIAVDAVMNATCNGGTNGSISITTSGGTAPYTYLWSDGSTDEDAVGLMAGNYTGTITDANGCEIVAGPVNITEPMVIGIMVDNATNPSCNGGADGSISITTMGGTAPYTYLWSNGDSDEDITGLSADSYTGTITDANGCTFVAGPVVLAEPAGLVVTDVVTDETLIAADDGAIDLTVSGGTAPYTYVWDNGATTEDLTALPDGIYCVTVSDANGCDFNSCYTVMEGSVAVQNIQSLNAFELYPNPAVTETMIDASFSKSVDLKLELVNVLGQTLHQELISSTINVQRTLDVSTYAAGVYFVRLTVDNQTVTKQLVIGK